MFALYSIVSWNWRSGSNSHDPRFRERESEIGFWIVWSIEFSRAPSSQPSPLPSIINMTSFGLYLYEPSSQYIIWGQGNVSFPLPHSNSRLEMVSVYWYQGCRLVAKSYYFGEKSLEVSFALFLLRRHSSYVIQFLKFLSVSRRSTFELSIWKKKKKKKEYPINIFSAIMHIPRINSWMFF